jgi:hypothetical protein
MIPMKTKNLMFVAAFLMVSPASIFAQCKLTSGDLSLLKGQSNVNLTYDYSHMATGKFKSDSEYVATKTKDMNKKKAGSGDDWAVKYKSDRESRFQPAFERNLNMLVEHVKLYCRQNANNAKYTMIVRTTFLDQGGFNPTGFGPRKSGYISLIVDIVESSNLSKTVASIEMKKEDGHSMGDLDVDTGTRIQSCYERAAEDLGGFIVTELLK